MQRERVVPTRVERHVAIQAGAQIVVYPRHERPESNGMTELGRLQLVEDCSVGLDDSVLEGEEVHPASAIETGCHLTEPGLRPDQPTHAGKDAWGGHRDARPASDPLNGRASIRIQN